MGISALEECVDSLITIPNQRLLNLAGENLSLVETFQRADEVLLNAVRGISDLINNTGLINADFADVSTVMANKGLALMGTGIHTGPDRAVKAATEAISSPLLEDISIDGATGIIINITGNSSLTAHETNEAVTLIMEAADEDAEIIFGTVIDEDIDESVKVTVIATGLSDSREEQLISNPIQELRVEQAPITREKLEIETPSATPVEVAEEKPSLNTFAPQYELKKPEKRETPLEINQKGLAESIKEAAQRYQGNKSGEAPREESFNRTRNLADSDENKSKAKSIAEKLGFMNFDDDEFDVPTYIRKDSESNEINIE